MKCKVHVVLIINKQNNNMGCQLQNKEKRGQGRPKKSTSTLTLTQVKKRRGRPPGSKNKNMKKIITTVIKTKIQSNVSRPVKKFPQSNQNKILVNNIFASQVAIQGKKNNYYNGNKNDDYFRILILDGKENNTANALISVGIKQNNIVIIEQNKDIFMSHLKNNFRVWFESIKDHGESRQKMLDEKSSNFITIPCLGIYFDTCGTINKEKDGILGALKAHRFVEGCVIVFTFTRSHISKEKHENDKKKFINELLTLTTNAGFCFNKTLLDHDYSGELVFKRKRECHMNTFGYTLKKIC